MSSADTDKILGVVLIVLGVLVAVGPLSVSWLVTVGALVAIVVGVLILAKQIRGQANVAVLLIVLGVLALGVPFLKDVISTIVNIVVGVVLVVLGVTKLQRKW